MTFEAAFVLFILPAAIVAAAILLALPGLRRAARREGRRGG